MRSRMPSKAKQPVKRSLTVAIVGPPNAGKSVLLNTMVKDHVSAVSRKRNTTSSCILGVACVGDTQLIFTDTPGAVIDMKEQKRLSNRNVVKAAKEAVCLANDLLLVVDAARRWNDDYRACLRRVVREGVENECHVTFVLNKVDLVRPKPKLLDMATDLLVMLDEEEARATQEALSSPPSPLSSSMLARLEARRRERPEAAPVFMVSAETGDGVDDIVDYLVSVAPEGDWMFPPNKTTDLSREDRLQELIKEHLFNEFHQEIPYSVDHETRVWSQRPDGSVTIYHDLLVASETHRKILLGPDGSRLERIRRRVVPQLEEMLMMEGGGGGGSSSTKVDLTLWIRTAASNQAKLTRARARGQAV